MQYFINFMAAIGCCVILMVAYGLLTKRLLFKRVRVTEYKINQTSLQELQHAIEDRCKELDVDINALYEGRVHPDTLGMPIFRSDGKVEWAPLKEENKS